MIGKVSVLLSPERSLTKICMVSSASAEEAREVAEETLEMLLERIMAGLEVDELSVIEVMLLLGVWWRWSDLVGSMRSGGGR